MVSYSRIVGRSRLFRGYSYLSRLPDHYYRHLIELKKPGARVHDDPQPSDLVDYKLADPNTGQITRVPDTEPNIFYTKESDEGLWGGEGLVKGFHKYRTFYGQYSAKIYFPTLNKAIVYSEILDKYLKVNVTKRALNLIDQAEGLDNYLLKTPVQDFKSRLALQLRRKLLISLTKEDYYPDDPKKKAYIKEKYKDFVIPLEEAEYFGLTLIQAITKLKIDEEKNYRPIPIKVKYARDLVAKLERMKEAGELEEYKPSLVESVTGIFRRNGKSQQQPSDSQT